MERNGITGAGIFVIDHVKIVNLWPEQGMLSLILDERKANGGCGYNVLKDLAKLGTNIPLTAVGITGNDEDGKYIFKDLKEHNIDTSLMYVIDDAVTSYTDVITVKDTGVRTFFYNKGASKFLDIKHFDFDLIRSKILHIGYILVLDSLDEFDSEYGTRMARLLKIAKNYGIKTSVDLVSESSDRFSKIVPPALRYTDYLIVNEIEAGKTTGLKIREEDGSINSENLKKSLDILIENGNSELVCIHFPEGAYATLRNGDPLFIPSHDLPAGFIKGTVGAGDAYCAGMLYGLHENWDLERCMRFAGAMAAICLTEPSTSDGIKSLSETLEFMEKMPLRNFKI